MALNKGLIVFAALALLLLQVTRPASADPPPTMDFTPPPNGACPVSCVEEQKDVNASFFLFKNADNAMPGEEGPGGKIIPIHVRQFPVLKGLGSSYTILDITPCGLSPPHVHPRGVELQYVIRGTMLIGFIDTQGELRLNVLKAGDISVVPQGMVHFTMSVDKEGFKSVAAFNSEEAGTIFVYNALLDTPDGVLSATTGLSTRQLKKLRSKTEFAMKRPTVNEQCLEDIKAGREFDFMKGASTIAGAWMYG